MKSPDRPLRRSQAIVPFGVGAMVDFPGPVTLIHAGLDAWPDPSKPELSEFRITDESRLARRLGVRYFFEPPDFRPRRRGQTSSDPTVELTLPFLRFPQWHVCPSCGRMFEAALTDSAAPECEGPVGTGRRKGERHRRTATIQVRFVAACRRGHLQDFPWWEWVLGTDQPRCEGLRLRMISRGSASLAGVLLVCEEDIDRINVVRRRSLAGVFSPPDSDRSGLSTIGVTCTGHSPHLAIPTPGNPPPGCGEPLFPTLKGSSSLYFPRVVSSIFIPGRPRAADPELEEILQDPKIMAVSMLLQAGAREVAIEAVENILLRRYPRTTVTAGEIVDALTDPDSSKGPTLTEPPPDDSEETAYRRDEYQLLTSSNEERIGDDLLLRPQPIDGYSEFFRRHVAAVALLPKLRETRAFVGFSRLLPEDGLSPEERWALISRRRLHWLPATVVRGEGIFLVLREEAIRAWESQHLTALRERAQLIGHDPDHPGAERESDTTRNTPRFLLLHTLSHILISRLTHECGYGSASLRERIYCSDHHEYPMSGILIYTAAGDSEGTLGGLVRMGRPGRLDAVLEEAVLRATWCSNDPVCIESRGQGPDNCNLAACHACALLPETSCEHQNRFLDRGLLVGTFIRPEIGFFNLDQS